MTCQHRRRDLAESGCNLARNELSGCQPKQQRSVSESVASNGCSQRTFQRHLTSVDGGFPRQSVRRKAAGFRTGYSPQSF
jgi:hypothetical protein